MRSYVSNYTTLPQWMAVKAIVMETTVMTSQIRTSATSHAVKAKSHLAAYNSGMIDSLCQRRKEEPAEEGG